MPRATLPYYYRFAVDSRCREGKSHALVPSMVTPRLPDGTRLVSFDLNPKAMLQAGTFRRARWVVASKDGSFRAYRNRRRPSFFLPEGRYWVSFWGQTRQGLIFRAMRELHVRRQRVKETPMTKETAAERHEQQTRFNLDLLATEGVIIQTRAIRGVDSRGAFKGQYSRKYRKPLCPEATVKMLLARLAEVIDFAKLKVEVTDRRGNVLSAAAKLSAHAERERYFKP